MLWVSPSHSLLCMQCFLTFILAPFLEFSFTALGICAFSPISAEVFTRCSCLRFPNWFLTLSVKATAPSLAAPESDLLASLAVSVYFWPSLLLWVPVLSQRGALVLCWTAVQAWPLKVRSALLSNTTQCVWHMCPDRRLMQNKTYLKSPALPVSYLWDSWKKGLPPPVWWSPCLNHGDKPFFNKKWVDTETPNIY